MSAPSHQPVRHILAVRFRPTATEDQITRLTKELRALQKRIPGIISIEHGLNNSPEGLNHGFTHIYILTMESVAARDTYLPHPEHKKFGEMAGQMDIIEEILVLDFVPDQTQ